jgi:hypothetical protein
MFGFCVASLDHLSHKMCDKARRTMVPAAPNWSSVPCGSGAELASRGCVYLRISSHDVPKELNAAGAYVHKTPSRNHFMLDRSAHALCCRGPLDRRWPSAVCPHLGDEGRSRRAVSLDAFLSCLLIGVPRPYLHACTCNRKPARVALACRALDFCTDTL